MTHQEVNPALAKPLALTAGITGLLQGVAWAIFAVLSICCHTRAIVIDVEFFNLTDTDYYKHIYYLFLLPDDNGTDTSREITPREFFIFMWFYVMFSIFWVIGSATVIWAMIHNQWHLVKYILGSWSVITAIISIIDVVLLSLIAVDYKQISDLSYNEINTNLITYGIVMTLVARGYVLWVINVILACVMASFVYKAIREENNDTVGPIINGYDTANSNPPWFNDDTTNTNHLMSSPKNNYQGPYENNRGFERSQSFFPASLLATERKQNDYIDPYDAPYNNLDSVAHNNTQENVTQTPFAASIANKVATIGKNKSQKLPPLNSVPTPVIPPPDYTPPGSPNALKPVLRSMSKY